SCPVPTPGRAPRVDTPGPPLKFWMKTLLYARQKFWEDPVRGLERAREPCAQRRHGGHPLRDSAAGCRTAFKHARHHQRPPHDGKAAAGRVADLLAALEIEAAAPGRAGSSPNAS